MTQSAAAWFAAADIGATSGRVILGRLERGRFDLTEVHRFPTPTFVLDVDGTPELHTDASAMLAEVVTGFRAAERAAGAPLSGIGSDTWGVDYGRLRADGTLLEEPVNYRDERTAGVPDAFFSQFPASRLYAIAGLQVMSFNTIFQLAAAAGQAGWDQTERILFLPDLITHHLSGAQIAEITIASTSGLLDVAARDWSDEIVDHLEHRYAVPASRVLPRLVEPGTVVGTSRPGLLATEVPVVTVGGHDTASAVVTIPAQSSDFAYISSGTWSLVGLELAQPVLTEASRQADFTNELGIDHTVRYLKNVMGLWVLTESQRQWERDGHPQDLLTLLDAAAAQPPLRCVLDMGDERLLPPGDMPARLVAMAVETGQRPPSTPAEFARCILDSLAVAYRRAIRTAQRLAGREVGVVHIVGGGCLNALLCQLTAEATGLPVIAGPSEGTALGNLLVQARATGHLSGDLLALRAVSRASSVLQHYRPGTLDLPADAFDVAESTAYQRHH